MGQSRGRDVGMTDPTSRLACLCEDHETGARDTTCGPTGFRPMRVRSGHMGLFRHHSSLPGIWYQQPQHSWLSFPEHLLGDRI